MNKIRFTQLFNESTDNKVLSDEEKLDIIKQMRPDEFDDIKAEYDEYIEDDDKSSLNQFWKEYQTVLDEYFDKQEEEKSGDEPDITESPDESEQSNDTETVDDEGVVGVDEDGNEIHEEDIDDTNTEEAINEMAATSEVGKGVDALDTDLGGEAYKICKEKIFGEKDFTSMEKDFREFAKYVGFDKNGKPKPEIEVLFKTYDGWPYQTGDIIKNDNKYFYDVACRNEYVLYQMAVQVYNDNNFQDVFAAALENITKGTECNRAMKQASKDGVTQEKLSAITQKIKTGSTDVFDEKKADGSNVKINNDIIIFIFLKILPSLIKEASRGKKASAKVLSNATYKKLYKKMTGLEENDDVLKQVIEDAWHLFIGGSAGARSWYEDTIKGLPLFNNANATTLNIFDTDWINNVKGQNNDNTSAKGRNFYVEMCDKFHDDPNIYKEFRYGNAKKAYAGPGARKAKGVNKDRYYSTLKGENEESIDLRNQTNEITDDDYNKSIRDKAKSEGLIVHYTCNIEPLRMIASKVSGQFQNFLTTITRAAWGQWTNINKKLFGKKYYTEDDIKNAKDDQERNEMLRINRLWEKEGINYSAFENGDVSLNTTIGKDDKGTMEDKLAAPNEEIQNDLKISLPLEFNNIKNIIADWHNRIADKQKSGLYEDEVGKDYFSLLKMEQWMWAGFKWLGYSPLNALNFAFGFQKDNFGGYGKGLAKQRALIKVASEKSYGKKVDFVTTKGSIGLGNTKGADEKKNKLLDSLAELRGQNGLWFLSKTEEGVKLNNNILNYLADDYDKTIGLFKDFVKPIQMAISSNDVNLNEYISTLGLKKSLWNQDSFMPERIDIGAFKTESNQSLLKSQANNVFTPWIKKILAGNLNKSQLSNLLNPKSENIDKNMRLIVELQKRTGINLIKYWDSKSGDVDFDLFSHDIEEYNNKHTKDKGHGLIRTFGDSDGIITLSDPTGDSISKSSNMMLKGSTITPKDNPSYNMDVFGAIDSEYANQVAEDFLRESVELEEIFQEVFRESQEPVKA